MKRHQHHASHYSGVASFDKEPEKKETNVKWKSVNESDWWTPFHMRPPLYNSICSGPSIYIRASEYCAARPCFSCSARRVLFLASLHAQNFYESSSAGISLAHIIRTWPYTRRESSATTFATKRTAISHDVEKSPSPSSSHPQVEWTQSKPFRLVCLFSLLARQWSRAQPKREEGKTTRKRFSSRSSWSFSFSSAAYITLGVVDFQWESLENKQE